MVGTGRGRCDWLAVAILLAGSLSAGRSPAQDTPFPTSDELYELGCRRLARGEFAAAIELLSAALVRQPDRGEIVCKLARAYEGSGQPGQARRLLENYLAGHPGDVAAGLSLARLLLEEGNPSAAVAVLDPLQAELGAEGACLLADAYRAAERAGDADVVLAAALERSPADERLWLAYIDAALEQGRLQEALRRTAAAEGWLGMRPALHLRAARAYFALGRILGDGRQRTPPEWQAGQFHGSLLIIGGREREGQPLCYSPESAMYQIRCALDGGLDDPAAHVLHARIWERCGRPEIGLAILQGREQPLIEANERTAIEALADLALAAGQLRDYLRYARELARCCPEQGGNILHRAYLAAAERYNQRGEEAVYAALLRRALELRPADTALRLRLADADWEAGRTRAAVQNYRLVLEQDREHPERMRILARLETDPPQ